MSNKVYDIFLSHNSADKPAVRALYEKLEANGCNVFFDDEDLPQEEIAGKQIDAALANTLVFAGCWGPAGVGPYHETELEAGFLLKIHKKISSVNVILPGAQVEDLGPRFGVSPPIVFSDLTQKKPLIKLLGAVDRARSERGLSDRVALEVAEDDPGYEHMRQRKRTTNKSDRLDDEDRNSWAEAAENLRKDARRYGLNFLLGPLTGIESPNGESPIEEELRAAEAGEHSPWELAHQLLVEDGSLQYKTQDSTHRLPLQLVASLLVMSRQNHRVVQDNLQSILKNRRILNSRFYKQAGHVLRLLLDTREESRGRLAPPPMILTTNFGTNLEWNMMYHGVPFTRITVKLPDTLIIQCISSEVTGDNIVLRDLLDDQSLPKQLTRDADDTESEALVYLANAFTQSVVQSTSGGEIDRTATAEQIAFDDMEGCILFKYHGSIDVDDSCVVNHEQLFELTAAETLVPAAVIERLKNAPTVVFGTSFLLTEVQQAVEAVWRRPFTSNRINRFIVPRDLQGLRDRVRDGWWFELEVAMRQQLRDYASALHLVELGPGQEKFLSAIQKDIEKAIAKPAGRVE